MFRTVLLSLIILALLAPAIQASDYFLIIIDSNSLVNQAVLDGYPGRSWGKTVDRIYLSGGDDEVCWLNDNGVYPRSIKPIDEPSSLYLCYGEAKIFASFQNVILDYGDGYVLAQAPLDGADSYRRLTLRTLPFSDFQVPEEASLAYDPVIAEMVNQVSQTGIINYDRGLSGEDAVIIGGQSQIIDTRYSGTADNQLATQYLLETLQGYGYQTEYHGFYSGALRHVAVYDANRAWAVTEGSTAIKTTNGGQSWTIMPDNASGALWGVANAGPDSVWIVGDAGTIRFSSNGGTSFVTQTSGTSYYLFGACFVNSASGWAAADLGRVLRTANSGQTWSIVATSTTSRLYDVCFIDANNGWACGRDGKIVRSTDGGLTWGSQTSNTTQRLYGIDFIDVNNGWTVGWGGVVRRTTNGGTTWQTVSLGISTELYHVDFRDSQNGCIVGWGGRIYTTSNGGTNWTQQSSGTASDFYGVDFIDNGQIGYAAGGGVLEKSIDGGTNWTNQTGGVEGSWLNVIATKPGQVAPDEQVIICGHMDCTSQNPSVDAPGADDNASGTTAVIEAARIYADYQFEKTIKFCLWNGEEQGLLGSAAYAGEAFARGDNIIGVFNFDMITWDGNADNNGELHCGTTSPSQQLGYLLQGVVADYAINLATDIITAGSTGGSDHASFWDYNYPAMLGIEDYSSDFNPYYHTTNDNITHVVASYFTQYTKAAVGATATKAVPVAVPVCSDVNMMPDTYPISVPPGGSFGLTGFIGNPTANPIVTDVWVGVVYQSNFIQLWNFPNIPLNSGQFLSAHLNQSVPGYAPAGTYNYVAYSGDSPLACDSAKFQFTVTGARIVGADEWVLEGGWQTEADTPQELALLGSYPNPFNASTEITYSLPSDADVRLEVFNLLGQKVATLVNGNIEAGMHSVIWDASRYSSGIYLYKLTSGEQTITKRMTLLK